MLQLERGLLSTFPPTELSFAYGSGVFRQEGYKANAAPMVDIVFAVRDPAEWHAQNLKHNRSHYSFLARLGSDAIASIQEDFGASAYYNTLVPLPAAVGGAPGQTMKYGVISVRSLLDDLLNWRTLYMSGRMHKPVRILGCSNPNLLRAARANLRHALSAALLMLPRSFTLKELYLTIAGLSYTGDFRMVFGENPHKVSNIVNASMHELHGLYAPVLAASFPTVSLASPPSLVEGRDSLASQGADDALASNDLPHFLQQDTSAEARLAVGLSLPFQLQQRMAEAWLHRRDSGRRVEHSLHSVSISSPSSMASKRVIGLAARGRQVIQRLQLQRLQWLVSRTERRAHRAAAVAAASTLFTGNERHASQTDARDDAIRAEHEQLLHLLEDEELRAQEAVAAAHRSLEANVGGPGHERSPLFSSSSGGGVDDDIATPSSSHYSRAVRDPAVVAFWEAMLQESGAAPSPLLAASTPGQQQQPLELDSTASSVSRSATVTLLQGGGSNNYDVALRAQTFLRPAIAHIVGTHARSQSLKGILTAGPVKAAIYGAAKLSKYVRGIIK